MTEILAVMSISTIAAAVTTFFVAAMGVRLLYAGYKLAKSALGRV